MFRGGSSHCWLNCQEQYAALRKSKMDAGGLGGWERRFPGPVFVFECVERQQEWELARSADGHEGGRSCLISSVYSKDRQRRALKSCVRTKPFPEQSRGQ